MFSYFWGSKKEETTETTETIAEDIDCITCPKCQHTWTPIEDKEEKDKEEEEKISLEVNKGQINIRQFSPDTMKKYFTALSIGRGRAGKTTLIKDLMRKLDLSSGTVICSTGEYVETEELKVVKEFTPEILEKFVSEITENNLFLKEKTMILDDCLFDPKWKDDENIRTLIINSRCLRCNLLMTQQYPDTIPVVLRANIDYIFIFKEPNLSAQRKLYRQYSGMFSSFEMFSQVLEECTKNYGCMVIDNTSHSNRIEDTVFWNTADLS